MKGMGRRTCARCTGLVPCCCHQDGYNYFLFQIPIVEKRALDLFTLKKYVNKFGGMAKVH